MYSVNQCLKVMKNKQVNVNNNVSAFLKLCPFKELDEVVKKFTCKNGSAILKYDLEHKIIAVNIGSNRFSACIVDRNSLKVLETMDDSINEQSIKRFFFSVGTWIGYARISYCVSNTGSTGYNSFDVPIYIGGINNPNF